MSLKIPTQINVTIDAHKQWLRTLHDAQELIENDTALQEKAAKGFWIKERRLPPEILGTTYAEYCDLINRMYDAYLNSVHLQRAPYIMAIISVLMKRMYELRNELVNLIVNDYIYVDQALINTRRTPFDIQIVIPYHLPLESREDSMEQLLQRMWADAIERKKAPPNKTPVTPNVFDGDFPVEDIAPNFISEQQICKDESVHTVYSEEYLQAVIIQTHERYRQFYVEDFKSKCRRRRLYFADSAQEAPFYLKRAAAMLIQKVYRKYMHIKRQRILEYRRDVLLGLVPDPFQPHMSFEEENNKMYERKRNICMKIKETYMKDFNQEKTRLLVFKKDNQIDDITEQIQTWFKEWYYGYGFFPDYPYEIEGGTVMVIRGDYPTIDEKVEEDEKYNASVKGKTKEMLKAEKKQAKIDALLKEEADREQKKKEEEQLFKLRCNPQSDPGYKPMTSQYMGDVVEALQKYQAAWSIYDDFPPSQNPDAFFGYMQVIMTEDIMDQMHVDCRKYVDELMRLDLKLLIKAQQQMYKAVGWKFPKLRARKKPKPPAVPKPLKIDDNMLEGFEALFDHDLISKPTCKIRDIVGDLKYGVYEFNVKDPDAKFPTPGYGDIRRRLTLSCVFGCGTPGAVRNKAVMLLGPARNGKSFLVDAVCGELNAVKIDITPEVFSAQFDRPSKVLTDVFLAARVFQPAVIYMRNIERVFCKKVAPEDKYLQAKTLKASLTKLLKQMSPDDKIIFIATCSNPMSAQAKPMVSIFNEVILVPRTDYNSLRLFFYERFQKIRSMPRDYCVQALAQVLQGYGFGLIMELYDTVINAERIVRLNVTPLTAMEFLGPLIEMGVEATSEAEYQEYVNFFITNSPLATKRQKYEIMNQVRAAFYEKMEKKKEKEKS
ncbi:unnamed protein product [Colias eurytheme]|nr:unnamed protein product [Colias eurytheme]